MIYASDVKLKPLNEPFLIDYGLHRWLQAGREEAYSDWFAWIIGKLTPRQVYRLFGISADKCPFDDVCVLVHRETAVSEGHEGQSGRIDLLIQFSGVVDLVVEIKKGDAESADTAKQAGYVDALRAIHNHAIHFILLIESADKTDYHGFQPRTWLSICLNLRCIVCELIMNNRISESAIILAFVSAVEQNLVGLSNVVELAKQGNFFNTQAITHLQTFISS